MLKLIFCIIIFLLINLSLLGSSKDQVIYSIISNFEEGENILYSNKEKAIQFFRNEIKSPSFKNKDSIIGQCYHYIAACYNEMGNLDSSFVNLKKAINFTDIPEEIVNLNTAIAVSFIKRKNYDSAYKYIVYSNKLTIGDDSLANSDEFIISKLYESKILSENGKFELAFKVISEAEKKAKLNSNSEALAILELHIAQLYILTKDYNLALKYYKRAEAYFGQTNYGKAKIFEYLGILYKEMGQFDTSKYYYERIIEVCKEANDSLGITNAYLSLIDLNIKTDNGLALKYFNLIDTNYLIKSNSCLHQYYKGFFTSQLNLKIPIYEYVTKCSDNLTLKKKVYKELYELYKKSNDKIRALQSLERYNDITFMEDNVKKAKAFQKVQLESYILEKERELKLEQSNNEKEIKSKNSTIIFSIIGLILLTFGLIYFYISFRKKSNAYNLSEKEKNQLKINNQKIKKELLDLSFVSLKDKKFIAHTKDELKKLRASKDPKGDASLLFAKTQQFVLAEEEDQLYKSKINNIEESFFNQLDSLAILNKKEKKMAALLKVNLTTKEIAPLLNVSEKTIERYRHVLRKKLAIEKNTSLHDFFNQM